MDGNHIEYHHDKAKYRPHVTREWTIQEDFAILPVVLACPSQIAYDAACRLLIGAFDRNPQHPPGTVLTAQDRARECRKLVEDRIDVLVSDRYNGSRMIEWLCGTSRDVLPLSWGEKEHVLKPWVRRAMESQPTLNPNRLWSLIERKPDYFGPTQDGRHFIIDCDLSRTEPDEEEPSPVGPKNIQKVYGAVTDFVRADIEDEYAVTTAWETLHRVCRELE